MLPRLAFERDIKTLSYDFVFIVRHPRSVGICFIYFDAMWSGTYMFVVVRFLDIVFALPRYPPFSFLILTPYMIISLKFLSWLIFGKCFSIYPLCSFLFLICTHRQFIAAFLSFNLIRKGLDFFEFIYTYVSPPVLIFISVFFYVYNFHTFFFSSLTFPIFCWVDDIFFCWFEHYTFYFHSSISSPLIINKNTFSPSNFLSFQHVFIPPEKKKFREIDKITPT